MQLYSTFSDTLLRYATYRYLDFKTILSFHSICKMSQVWARLDLASENFRIPEHRYQIFTALTNNQHPSAEIFTDKFIIDAIEPTSLKQVFDFARKINDFIRNIPMAPANIFPFNPLNILPKEPTEQKQNLAIEYPKSSPVHQEPPSFKVLNDDILNPFMDQLHDPVTKSRMYDYLTFLVNEVNDKRTTYHVVTKIPQAHRDLYFHVVELMNAKLLINQAVDVMKHIPEKEEYEQLLIECLDAWLKAQDKEGPGIEVSISKEGREIVREMRLETNNVFCEEYADFVERCIYVLSKRKNSNIVLLKVLHRMGDAGEIGLRRHVDNLFKMDQLDAAISFVQALQKNDAHSLAPYHRSIHLSKRMVVSECAKQKRYYDALSLCLEQPYFKENIKLYCDEFVKDFQENAHPILLGFADQATDASVKSILLSCCANPQCQSKGHKNTLDYLCQNRGTLEQKDFEEGVYTCFTQHFKENPQDALEALRKGQEPYKSIYWRACRFITIELFKQGDLQNLEFATTLYLRMSPIMKKFILDEVVDAFALSHQIDTFFYLMNTCNQLGKYDKQAYYSKLDHAVYGLRDETKSDHFVKKLKSYDTNVSKIYHDAIKFRAETVGLQRQLPDGLFKDIEKITIRALKDDAIACCITALIDSGDINLARTKINELLGNSPIAYVVAIKQVVIYYLKQNNIEEAFKIARSVSHVDFNTTFNNYAESCISTGNVETAQEIYRKLSFG